MIFLLRTRVSNALVFVPRMWLKVFPEVSTGRAGSGRKRE